MCGCLSCTPPAGDQARNPGLCLDWELNRQPFGSQAGAQPTEPHQPGPGPFSQPKPRPYFAEPKARLDFLQQQPRGTSPRSPVPQISWRRSDGLPLPRKMRLQKFNGVLEIPSFQQEDAGSYECVAENARGRNVARGRLTYYGGFPRGPEGVAVHQALWTRGPPSSACRSEKVVNGVDKQ